MLLKHMSRWLAFVSVISFVQGRIEHHPKCIQYPQEIGEELQVVCHNVTSMKEVFDHIPSGPSLRNITSLTFMLSNFSSLTLDNIVGLPSLRTLSFNQSHISNWTIPKAESVPNVTVLIIDNCWNNYLLISNDRTASLELANNTFDGLQSLEHVYIVNCYVSYMREEAFKKLPYLKKLHISHGSGIGCEQEMKWLLEWQSDGGLAEISSDTLCFVPKDLAEGGGGLLVMSTYYSLDKQPFIMIMKHRKETQKHCAKECKCVVEGYNIERVNQQRKGPIINVNCSHANLTALPNVPPYSSRLNFAYNNITDISKIFTDENYNRITTVRLEHNQISYLDGDLFLKFLNGRPHDLFINLAFNNFTTFPVKQMLQIQRDAKGSHLGANNFKPFITLEFNPWDCNNCSFLPEFQELVYYQYYPREKDHVFYDNIRCAEGDDFFSGQMVLKLDVEALCVPDPPLLQPIDILNISLGLLIILFVANFAHNYYQYRHNSKLPWIVTKMPCC